MSFYDTHYECSMSDDTSSSSEGSNDDMSWDTCMKNAYE